MIWFWYQRSNVIALVSVNPIATKYFIEERSWIYAYVLLVLPIVITSCPHQDPVIAAWTPLPDKTIFPENDSFQRLIISIHSSLPSKNTSEILSKGGTHGRSFPVDSIDKEGRSAHENSLCACDVPLSRLLTSCVSLCPLVESNWGKVCSYQFSWGNSSSARVAPATRKPMNIPNQYEGIFCIHIYWEIKNDLRRSWGIVKKKK